MRANDIQVDGNHYQKGTLQHWDVMIIMRTHYMPGCASKYLLRHQDKNGLLDLQKAQHFLQKMIECAGEYFRPNENYQPILVEGLLATHGTPPALHSVIRAILDPKKSVGELELASIQLTDYVAGYEADECDATHRYTNQG